MPKETITRSQARDLYLAIKSLEGRYEVAKDDNGKTLGIILKPFNLEAKARYALARNLRALQDEVDSYEQALRPLQKSEEDHSSEVLDLGRESISVELYTTPISLLKIDTNQIAPAVIAALLPILSGEL